MKFKTIKAREGKGVARSIMQLLDDASDEDDDSLEVESEDESDDDQPGSIEGHSVDENLDAELSSNDEGSQSEDDEGPEGGITFNNGHQTIKRLQDDLLADEDEPDDGMFISNLAYSIYLCLAVGLSTHERRLSLLQQQITALEAENIAKKDWTLMGEATSRMRPENSLLEKDLEFERVMKAVPVITEELISSLEGRIKARILEGRFDDVVRKRPIDDKPFLPSRVFELQDTKSKQSLAQIYEDEYSAAQTGGVVGEDRDGKLEAEHKEITRIWETISSKLDALSNAHFTPKAVSAHETLTLLRSKINVAPSPPQPFQPSRMLRRPA